ncbi:MAG TPA: ABC transporter substrate-binding protein [Flavisolibacter sp.]|jgi:ABC-type branched-subunit amino acid transport system substrate-binding protein|nr:ABC transporter substrate-binding protein [Flavisolibacter sp.]
MKKIYLLFALSLGVIGLQAQPVQRIKVAVFSPLYLDSAFDSGGNFKFDKNNFPKISQPGLEFYQGVQLALDSLEKRDAPLEVFVYDTRGRESIIQQLNRPELSDVSLILAPSNAAETKLLAEAAERKKIPFVSATLPNDAGIDNNPYFVVLNSTLQTHIEGIYQFLQKYHKQDRIVVFRKAGAQEDQLRDYFMEYGKSVVGSPLAIKFVDVSNGFTTQTIAANLDSTRRNICIAGSLDESFGVRLAQDIAQINKTYPVTLVGMPTWERMNFSRAELNNVEVIYTSPFYYNRLTPLESRAADDFTNRMSSKPSDLFFRGYETMLRFGLLLLDTKKDMASNLTRKGNTVFTQFDIQPVFKDKQSMTLDYFENKHLYFIKAFGGVKNILY